MGQAFDRANNPRPPPGFCTFCASPVKLPAVVAFKDLSAMSHQRIGGPFQISEFVNRTYSQKLRDPRWQKRRLERLEKSSWRCDRCLDSKSELQVHHNWYVTGLEPWEYNVDQLSTLCVNCHEVAGEVHKKLKTLLSTTSVDRQMAMAAAIYDVPEPCVITNYEDCQWRHARLLDCFFRIFNRSVSVACRIKRLHDHKGCLMVYAAKMLQENEEQIIVSVWEELLEGFVEFFYDDPDLVRQSWEL
jgi:hypothetical protein